MDKIKGMLHGGHKKEGDHAATTTTTTGTGTAAGYGEPTTTGTTTHQATGEKKEGLLGKIKKHAGSSSSSSSDEEREGARERNRIRREKRAQRKAGGVPMGTATGGHVGTGTGVPMEGAGEKKHGFFG